MLFVPGGAFIADFEAVDLFFLYQWVRATGATLLYVSYDFAPQAPYPTAQLQVLQVYLALPTPTPTPNPNPAPNPIPHQAGARLLAGPLGATLPRAWSEGAWARWAEQLRGA